MEQIEDWDSPEDKRKDREWHKKYDCAESYTSYHQRRNKMVNGENHLIEVPPYCFFCKKKMFPGPDTPIPGDKNWQEGSGI